MPLPAMIAGAIPEILTRLGLEFGKGPLANAPVQVAQFMQSQFGVQITRKKAEWIVGLIATASGVAFEKAAEKLPMEEIGREVRAALGSGAEKLGNVSNAQLGALAVRSLGLGGESGRCCAHCGKALPATAHPNRRYCDDLCRGRAAAKRRLGQSTLR